MPRPARRLRALLAEPSVDGWDDAQEEGVIDGRRPALLIGSPAERGLFRGAHIDARADCGLAS